MNTNTIMTNSYFLKNNIKTDVSGRLYFDYVVLTIHKDASEYQGNYLCWLEENVRNNLDSAQTMPLIAQFINEDKDEPLGHGYVTHKNDRLAILDSEQVGNVVSAEIKDVEVEGKTIRALVATGYVNEIRYPMLCQWLRATMFEGKAISTSVEIFAKKGNKDIVSDFATDADDNEICIPKEFDFGGSAILTVTPADENAIVLEILNSRNYIEKNAKEEKEVNLEEIQKNLDTVTAENEANKATINTLNNEKSELEAKVNELETKINELEKDEDKCTGEDGCTCEKCKAISENKAKCEALETEKETLEAKVNELTEENKELNEFKTEVENEKTIADFEEKAKDYSEDLLAEVKDDIDDFKNEPTVEKADNIINTLNARFVEKAKKTAIPEGEEQNKLKVNSLFVEVTPEATNAKDDEIKIWE